MKRGRLLILLDGFFLGGTETQIYSTVPDLLRADMDVTIVGADGPMREAFSRLGCKIYHIDFPLEETVSSFTWTEIEQQLEDIIERESVNIIHGHQLPSARFVTRTAKRRGIPMYFTVHGTYYETEMLKAVLGDSVRIISVSPPIYDWLATSGINSVIVPNGISTDYFQAMDDAPIRNAYGLSPTTPVIVYAARMAWEKADIGVQLIQVCRNIRKEAISDLHLLIAGQGDGFQRILNLANAMNSEEGFNYIRCLGEQMDLRPVFSVADCVVGTGRVAMEAMSCSRPVIAVGSRGMVGVVNPATYDLAMRYHFGDHRADRPITEAALAAAITGVMSATSETRQALGQAGRELMKSNFDIHAISNRLLAEYRLMELA